MQTEQTYKGDPIPSAGAAVPQEFLVVESATPDTGLVVAEASTNTGDDAAADAATMTDVVDDDVETRDVAVQSAAGQEKLNFSQYVKFTLPSSSAGVQAEPPAPVAPSVASATPMTKKPHPLQLPVKAAPPGPPQFGVGSKASTAGYNESFGVVDLRRVVNWDYVGRRAGDPIEHLLNNRHACMKLPQLKWIVEWIKYQAGQAAVKEFALNHQLNLWELQAIIGCAKSRVGLGNCESAHLA